MEQSIIEKRFLDAYDMLAPAVFRFSFMRVSDKALAEDLTQDAFMKTWKYLSDGNEVLNLKAFIFKTATNLIIDHYRKKKESSLDALMDDGFDVEGDGKATIEDQALGREALALVQKLEPGYREVIVMRFVEGLPVDEIAEIMGESPNVVSVRIHRALKKLKAMLHI